MDYLCLFYCMVYYTNYLYKYNQTIIITTTHKCNVPSTYHKMKWLCMITHYCFSSLLKASDQKCNSKNLKINKCINFIIYLANVNKNIKCLKINTII